MNPAWLILLLPIAAASGWWFALRKNKDEAQESLDFNQSCLQGINQLLNTGDDEALTEFLNTMDQQPRSVELQIVLGNLCRRKGEYERASLIHQAILNNSSHTPEVRESARFELAQDYQAAGWLDRAESLYVDLLNSPKHQRDTAENLLRIYQQENDWENAIQMANYLGKLGLSSAKLSEQLAHLYCEQCEQHMKAGRFPDAEKFLRQAEKADPANPRVVILDGRISTFKGDHAKAISAWNRLLLLNPGYIGVAMSHIQDSFQLIRDRRAYLKFLKQALKANEDPAVMSALLETLKTAQSQSPGKFLVQYLKDKPNIEGLKQILLNWQELPTEISHQELLFLVESMTDLSSGESPYQCAECGFKAVSFDWSCPGCHQWGSYHRNQQGSSLKPRQHGVKGVELEPVPEDRQMQRQSDWLPTKTDLGP